MNYDLILNDAITYIKMQKSESYKRRLNEAYMILKQKGINGYEEFEKSNTGIGAFTYTEITIFDRIKNEDYYRALSSFYLEVGTAIETKENLGDMLASYGTVGETPYREGLIRKGYIVEGLTEEEKNKFY